MTSESRIRLDLVAHRSEAIELLERIVGFTAAMQELGLEVVISGQISLVVRSAPIQDPPAEDPPT
jgi:hypothetical protein